ncbi:MAG: hypothetical protein HOY69_27730 [Streptomyces sp.]|nr:hypothetical protein [Streptomyces sp.]
MGGAVPRESGASGGAVCRGAVAAAGVLLALTALQAGPAHADGATPAAAPATWQPQGTQLTGAATTADAPSMTPGVTYRDTIKVGETRFYGIALDNASSAYASAFALPAPGRRVAYGDGIELTLLSADGDRCDSADAHFGADSGVRPVGTAVSRTIAPDESCQDANQYTLSVHRTSDGASDPAPWPLELRSVLEPPLKAGASAGHPPSEQSGTPTPTPLTGGTPRQAAGGTSFETAAAVRTGIWKDKVLPGETRFYKVPVDWGQQATVFSDFSSARVTDSSAYVSSGVRLTAFSPVRELIDDDAHSYDGTPASLHEQLAPVSYANRVADDSHVAPVRFAGWYYFAVTVHPGVAKAVSGAVPVTLRIDVSGSAQEGPGYAGNARAAGIGVGAHDVSSANGEQQSAGSASDGVSVRRFLGFAALGAGTVLVLGLGGWTLAARRRQAVADAVTQPQPPQPGYGPPRW